MRLNCRSLVLQAGFRKRHGTEDAALVALGIVEPALAQQNRQLGSLKPSHAVISTTGHVRKGAYLLHHPQKNHGTSLRDPKGFSIWLGV